MNTHFSTSRAMAWMVWIIASIFYAYQYVLRVMPSILLTDIMQRFHIDSAIFGQFSGIYYIGYSLMHVPLGILLDRVGPKKVMSASILLTVLGLMPLIFANSWTYPMIGRLCIGMGSSAAILGLFKIIRMLFEEKRFSRMLSFSVMVGLIGAIYGGGPVHYMLQTFGYTTVVYLFAFIGIILSCITYLLVPHVATTAQNSIASNIQEVFKNPRVILSCICAGLMVGPLEGFADVWGTSFLKSFCHFDRTVAASLPSIIFIGMCFGSPILNFMAERSKNYFLTIIGSGIIMVIGFVMLLSIPLSTSLVSMHFAVIGICSAYQILAICKVSTFVRAEIAGLTTAVANMIIMIFGYLFHTTIGHIVSIMGGPQNPQALYYGVAVVPIALALGVMGFTILLFQERTKQIKEAGND